MENPDKMGWRQEAPRLKHGPQDTALGGGELALAGPCGDPWRGPHLGVCCNGCSLGGPAPGTWTVAAKPPDLGYPSSAGACNCAMGTEMNCVQTQDHRL